MTNELSLPPDRAKLRARLDALTRKHAKARQDVIDAQLELLASTWAAIQAGTAEWSDLYAIADQCRAAEIGGWTVRWNQVIPIPWQKVQHLASTGHGPPVPAPPRPPARYGAEQWELRQESGRLSGAVPKAGVYVVYELQDHEGEPLYIGATSNLLNRLSAHRDKPWVRCAAREAADKIDAEGLEAVAILSKRPPLNKQITSFGGARTLIAAATAASVDTPELAELAEGLHVEAIHQTAASDILRYLRQEGTTWAGLCRANRDQAEIMLMNTAGSMSFPLDLKRVLAIVKVAEEQSESSDR